MSLGPVMLDIDGLALSPADRDLLREPAVGGVILFTRNFESPGQIADLVQDIRALRSPPLLIAVDHEGGRVQRFRNGFTAIPPMRRIGREYRGEVRVRHIATLLRDEVGYETIKDSLVTSFDGLKMAIHYGCHLLKPSKIMQVDDPNDPHTLEDLVRALGAEPVRHRNWYLCCGKACQDEEIPSNMMHDLLGTVHEEQADLLCLICPTCFGQFDTGQMKVAKKFNEDFHTPAIYYLQLLALAQGTPYEKLGLGRQRFKPECLRRFDTAPVAGG